MTTYNATLPQGVEVKGEITREFSEILTPKVLRFVRDLQREFGDTREKLLMDRTIRQRKIDQGYKLDFLPETEHIRKSNWKVESCPEDIQDRRVEITGPVDRKMIINALNSGAKVFMADFEDSNSPTWKNNIQGQINLRDAVRRTITFEDKKSGKKYALKDEVATLFVRVRGLHMEERHVFVDGKPVSGGILDFGLYFFHNAKVLMENGSGPYFYLPKLESYLEARLWNDIFIKAQQEMDIPSGTIKATVLIETIVAAFEMDEILYELREHSAGLNCGRWDYIFSFLKKFRNNPDVILPDRSVITMDVHFMRSYSLLAIKTCHKRGAFAMGGMAAQIPIKNNPEANKIAFEKVKQDKLREAKDGHDGTWVAHPGLISVAMEVFNNILIEKNQIAKQLDEIEVDAKDLLEVPKGDITEQGLRNNISVGIQYIEAWLNGSGAVPIFNLMEDAATAEISRSQVWQWVRHEKGTLEDGRKITLEIVNQLIEEELQKVREIVGSEVFENGKYKAAIRLFKNLTKEDHFTEFLTLPGYEILLSK